MQTDSFGPQDLLAVVTLLGLVWKAGEKAWKWYGDRSKKPTDKPPEE